MKEILDLRLYTVGETAELLATNAAAVRRYIKAGALRAAKIGAAQMITEGAIKDYLNGVTAQPQSAESYLNTSSTPIYKAKEGEKEQPREKEEEPGARPSAPKAKKAKKEQKTKIVKKVVAKTTKKTTKKAPILAKKTQKEGNETPAKPLQQKKAKQMITQDLGDGWAVTYDASILDK
jgi:outer membrane biosynthesis protein TonB